MQQHLNYEHPRPWPKHDEAASSSVSSRTWAWAFLLSGGYALACIPAVFLFERLRWPDDPIHLTSFFACLICLGSASQYLTIRRAEDHDRSATRVSLRLLARLAIGVTVGLLLFVLVVMVLWMVTMNEL